MLENKWKNQTEEMIESFLVLSEIVFEQLVEEMVMDYQKIRLERTRHHLTITP